MAIRTTGDAIESGTDGHAITVTPSQPGTAEFNGSTAVFYVNGIDTTLAEEAADARHYANEIHQPVTAIHAETKGMAADIVTTAEEKLGFANNPPEITVAQEVLRRVQGDTLTEPVHFMAHSRGALIVQRGLEHVVDTLKSQGMTPSEIGGIMNGISVETAGGASLGMPAGVRCVNYVNPHDPVANLLGQGEPSLKDVVEIDAAAGAIGVALPLVALGAEDYLLLKPAITHPNGPDVAVPPVAPQPGIFGDMLANHAIGQYLAHREPFEATYAAWSAQHQTTAHAAAAQAAAEPAARAAETAYATHVVSDARGSSIAGLLTQKIEALNTSTGSALPAPREILPWQNTATYGSLVALDPQTLAQHTGRGTYQVLDLSRDLHDIMPPLGQPLHVSAAGITASTTPPPEQTR